MLTVPCVELDIFWAVMVPVPSMELDTYWPVIATVPSMELNVYWPLMLTFPCLELDIRGVFQKYAERFHRMFAIAARLMIFHVKHAWYMFIKYRENQGLWSSIFLETVAKATQGSSMRGNFLYFPPLGPLLNKSYLNGNQFENKFGHMLSKNKCYKNILT